ncbi:MAG: arginine--tRNA ligase, partial [Betaproteobacteria bacterium]|nr:arginine--tRNA ligase [Betaproteobacteria bacterium]
MEIINQLRDAVISALDEMDLEISPGRVTLERPKSTANGDYACNVAMQLARELKKNPREIAQEVISKLSNFS